VRVEVAAPTVTESVTVTTSTESPVDLERLTEVTRNNAEKTRRLLTTFLAQADEGKYKLHAAIGSGAAGDVRQIAHKLVGAGSSIGMMAVVPTLSQLEQMGDAGQLEGAAEVLQEFSGQLERVRQFVNEYLNSRAPSGPVSVS
jgi:HPt (histidine-containing phosphotransfer) domain-containing protein